MAIVSDQRVDRRGRCPVGRLDHEQVGADTTTVLGEFHRLAGPPGAVGRHDQGPLAHVLHDSLVTWAISSSVRSEKRLSPQVNTMALPSPPEENRGAREGGEIDLAWRVKGCERTATDHSERRGFPADTRRRPQASVRRSAGWLPRRGADHPAASASRRGRGDRRNRDATLRTLPREALWLHRSPFRC